MNFSAKAIFTTLLLLFVLKGRGQEQRLGGSTSDPAMLPGKLATSTPLGDLYSPDLYTGTGNVSIPIYSYSSGKVNFGISLGYNTKGILVDEQASDIGLHFGLTAGFSIVRTVKDLPDEINLLDGDTLMFQWSGLSFMKPIPGWPPAPYDTVSLNKFWAFKGKYVVSSESPGSASDSLIYRDKEADDFTVMLGSSSFTFNLGSNGNYFIYPQRSIKIETLWDDQPFTTVPDNQPMGQFPGYENLLGFRITDEEGNKFIFKRGEYETRQIEDVFGTGNIVTNYSFTTKWVIDEVILSTGRSVKYSYYSFSGNGNALPSYKANTRREGIYPSDTGPDSFLVHSSIYHITKVKEIWYPNNVRASFLYGATPRLDGLTGALKEIRISTAQNCLRYIMKQSYFASGNEAETSDPDETTLAPQARPGEADRSKRLRLDAILLASCDSSLVERYYSFTYDPLKLPPRFDPSQDYFGYFNDGAFISTNPGNIEADARTLIPRHHIWYAYYPDYNTYSPTQYFMDRTPDPSKAKACLLRTVKNAMGGILSLYYGEHRDITSPLDSILPTDQYYFGKGANEGLRVDSIIEWEPIHPENAKVTVFNYSGGQRFMDGGYFHAPDRMHGNDYSTAFVGNIIFNGRYQTPHQMVNGSNVGYSFAEVIEKNNQGDLLGRKTYKFTNFLDDEPGSKPKYFVIGGGKNFFTYPYTDKQYLMDWMMGKILEVKEYNYSNKITRSITSKYKFTLDTTSSIGLVENVRETLVIIDGIVEPGISHVFANMKFQDYYRPYTGTALLDTEIVRSYVSDNQFLSTTAHYTYDYKNRLKEIFNVNSDGSITKTSVGYNYSVSAAPGSVLANMTQAGIEVKVATEKWKLSSTGIADDELLNASYDTYDYQNGILTVKNRYDLQLGQPLTFAQYTGYTGGILPPPFPNAGLAFSGGTIPNFKKSSMVAAVDPTGNPREFQLSGLDQYASIIWDTLTGQKLAEVNARLSDIAYSSFELGTYGNWSYTPGGASAVADPVTGINAYQLSSGAISKGGLAQGKIYKVSFWVTTSSPIPTCAVNGNALYLTPGPVKGNWKYYEGEFTAPASSTSITISGASGFLDELRLFPREAAMDSWTYNGLFGASSHTNAAGRIEYYGFDKLGRPNLTTDQEGNIKFKSEIRVQQ